MEEEVINVVTCSVWVPRGAAKEDPDKVEITKDVLAKIISQTSQDLSVLEMKDLDEDEYTEMELESMAKDLKINVPKQTKDSKKEDGNSKDEVKMVVDETDEKEMEDENFENEYKFGDYYEKKESEKLFDLSEFTVHSNLSDDPHMISKEDDSESEKENVKILPTDNLIAVGHVEGDAAILEVYVYNSTELSLYVHHDVLLPAVPLCMEWLNFDPIDENLKPGNLVAIGSMSSVIEVWDLDVIDCLEPSFRLGRKPNKKKKLCRLGHSDAVLSLAWNSDLEHILASGSADKSVILWDLQKLQESQKLTDFSHRVQDLKWHPKQNHFLLSASSDKYARLFDCLSEDNGRKWKLDGEVECLTWDPLADSYVFYAGTDTGSVYCIDARQDKPVHHFQAHQKTCSGLTMNSDCAGCLVSVSEDEAVKIWDVSCGTKATLVEESRPGLGVIHSVGSSVDCPFVLSLAGNNKVNNFKVWDIRDSRNVRAGFYDRLGLPIEEEGKTVLVEGETVQSSSCGISLVADVDGSGRVKAAEVSAKWKPGKKSKKKKGGRLDRKKKK